VTRWQPCRELTCLLEALGEDIVAAGDDEVGQMHGGPIAGTVREVRLLIQAARGDRNEGLRADLAEDLRAPGAGLRPASSPRRLSHHQRH
jgi:hypothetical protein